MKTECCQKIPNVFIVGAPKCGTSALSNYLGAHPDLFMGRKEMHFFGADLSFGPQFYRRDRAAYLAEFEGWTHQRWGGEASVWYLLSSQAAAEIKVFNPDARIIIMLREPAAMLYSLYHQFRSDGNEHLATFREALAAENDRQAGRRIRRQAYFPRGLLYRSTAGFTTQVRRYFQAFGRERVKVIIYDDLRDNPAGVYQDALVFLGLDATKAKVDFKVVNGSQSARSSLLGTVLNDPLVRGTAISLRSRLPRPVFNILQKAGDRLSSLNKQPEKRQPLDADLAHSLRREFAPEVESLSELLQRDLTHWSRGPLPPGQPAPAVSANENQTACPAADSLVKT